MHKKINVIDLFAGPGGLGEGFSAFEKKDGTNPFKIRMSVEMESSAHQTLQLRAFFRQFKKGRVPEQYYEYLRDPAAISKDELFNKYRSQAEQAIEETLSGPRQLGDPKDDAYIYKNLSRIKRTHKDELFVVIGGPPCQAYSLAGRSRNAGKAGYKIEKDHRINLYKEYLKVLDKITPEVFVMENVKGILSSKSEGKNIFPQILQDLRNPKKALGKQSGPDYYIYSLVSKPDDFDHIDGPSYQDPSSYTIKCENYGIPQARHRVILLGVRKDLNVEPNILDPSATNINIESIIAGLPRLRSGLSKEQDSASNWVYTIKDSAEHIKNKLPKSGSRKQAGIINQATHNLNSDMDRGGRFVRSTNKGFIQGFRGALKDWLYDSRVGGFINHETRGHIRADLERYLWAASYSEAHINENNPSPKASNFPSYLTPNHKNWKSGDHADRFRVQVRKKPATTITSHISKDGHYFIHYDPSQCRSLTVREAARIQTFPDNYFFEGNRTQQYVQVGNAVPPYLAKQIADIVFTLLEG